MLLTPALIYVFELHLNARRLTPLTPPLHHYGSRASSLRRFAWHLTPPCPSSRSVVGAVPSAVPRPAPAPVRKPVVAKRKLDSSTIPSSRLARLASFGNLAVGLMPWRSSTQSRATVLSAQLRRLRGGALKLGQMLSLQDKSVLPEPWSEALAALRDSADSMPRDQLDVVFKEEWGLTLTDLAGPNPSVDFFELRRASTADGRESSSSTRNEECEAPYDDLARYPISDSNIMKSGPAPGSLPVAIGDVSSVDPNAMAAASIGQVHLCSLKSGATVCLKVQYPLVLTSIKSDISNLMLLLKVSNVAPPGLFIDQVVEHGLQELTAECDYVRELRLVLFVFIELQDSFPCKKKKKKIPFVFFFLSETVP